MASRPVFIPVFDGLPGVRTETVSFVWHAGLSKQQKRKNVDAIHEAVQKAFPKLVRPLEISSKSRIETGVALSAFNLGVASAKSGGFVCVESLYQASKVFADAGPFPELYTHSAREVRGHLNAFKDQALVAFDLHGERWPLVPRQAFYAWIYCQALHRNARLATSVQRYDCFTDIEFNPERSVNCQAYAAAFYVSLSRCGKLKKALSGRESFLEMQRPEELPKKRRQAAPARRRGGSIPGNSHSYTVDPDVPALPLLDLFFPSVPET